MTAMDIKRGPQPRQRHATSVDNHLVTRDAIDPAPTSTFADWKERVAPVANRAVGKITADITDTAAPPGESPLGNLIADAQLRHTRRPAGAQIALMNPGGVRAALTYPVPRRVKATAWSPTERRSPSSRSTIWSSRVTGAQLKTVLEQQWAAGTPPGRSGGATVILQVSGGFTYSYNDTLACGSRISDMKVNATPIISPRLTR